MMGHSFITGMLQDVAQPVFAQAGEDIYRQQNIFRKMLRFTSFISFPLMFGLSLVSRELIVITITDKWLPAAEILSILCIGGAFLPIIRLYSNFIISRKKTNIYMWNTICSSLLLFLVLIIFYPIGMQPMLLAFVTVNTIWLFVWHYFLWNEIKLSLLSAMKDVLPFCCIAAFVMCTTYFITISIQDIYIYFL